MSSSSPPATAISTETFLNGIGVDAHIPYTDGGYVNIPNVISDLQYLGVTQVRDGITNGENGSAPLSSYIALAQAGIQFTFIIEDSTPAAIASRLSLIDQVEKAVPGSVIAIEGPNEINNQPITFNGVSGVQGAVNLQAYLYAAVHADPTLAGVAVDYFTGYGEQGVGGLGPDPTKTAGLADYDNQHPYPNFGQAPAYWVDRAKALINTTSPTAPAVYTETGYSTNQVDPTVQAKYTLDLLMDTAQSGIAKTYLYQLMDAYAPGSYQGDDGFGLFDYTKTAKPVANAIHNLTTLLQDTGAQAAGFQAAPLAYSISGLPSTGNSMVMEDSNGTYFIVVWAEPQIWDNVNHTEIASPSSNVTVNLPSAYGSIQVFDPLTGLSAIQSETNSSSVTVAVTDHPLIIQLTNAGAPPPPSAPTLTLNAPSEVAGAATAAVTVTGTVSAGATAVEIYSGSTDLGAATLDGKGGFSFTDSLAPGAYTFKAVATDLAGNTASAVDPVFNATVTPPVTTTTTPPTTSGPDTLVLNVSEIAVGGRNAQFIVDVDGQQVGGVQTVKASEPLGQSKNITLNGDFGAGPHTVTIQMLDGFTGAAADAGRTLFVNAITLDNSTTFTNGRLMFNGPVGYAVQGPATPVASNVGTNDTLVLNVSGDAAGGANAQFAVSVDGQMISGVQMVRASHATGGSQTITLHGDFGSGPHTVAIDFVNGFSGAASDIGRTLYVNSITLDGLTTTENATQTYQGAQTYTVQAGDPTTTPPPVTPTVTITSQVLAHDTGASASDNVTNDGAVTLTGTVAGPAGTTVEIFDGTTDLGQATLNGAGGWTYATTLSSGDHTLHAVASDPAVSAAEPTIVVDNTPPTLTLNRPSEVAGAATAAVTVTGTVSAGATAVEIYSGSTDLGAATLDGKGGFSFTDALAPGAYTFKAVATDLAGNTASAVDPVFNATVTPPVTTTPPPTTSGPDTLVLNVSEIAVGGKNAQFIVDVDGQQVGGVQTATASQAAGASQNIALTGDFGSGPHTVTIQMLDGFTGAAADAGRTLFVNAITLDNSTTFTNGRLMFNGPVSYGLPTPATAPASNVGAADTLTLNLSEAAVGGADARFMVSVDGQIVGGVQTVTASHAAGASENVTLAGDFGSGPHTVAIDFINGFGGAASDIGRKLYVNAITLDGLTTTENSTQMFLGAQSYTVQTGTAASGVAGGALTLTGGGAATVESGLTSIHTVDLTGPAAGQTQAAWHFTAPAMAGLTIDDSGGQADVIMLGAAGQSVISEAGTTDHVVASAAQAGALITASGGDVLEITGGGAAALNLSDTGIAKVQLDQATTVSLGANIGLIQGSVGADHITLGGTGEVVTGGGGGDVITGYSGGGDTFLDHAANFDGSTIGNFAAAGDKIDVTDVALTASDVSFQENANNSMGVLTLMAGANAVHITLLGQFSSSDFHVAGDGALGSLVTYGH